MAIMHHEKIFGMDINELSIIKKKLCVLGINLTDLTEFLDRDKIQLFAEQKRDIGYLKSVISDIRKAANVDI